MRDAYPSWLCVRKTLGQRGRGAGKEGGMCLPFVCAALSAAASAFCFSLKAWSSSSISFLSFLGAWQRRRRRRRGRDWG